jgi:RNA polymerase sigma-70 factor (ECF subfamily)
VKNYEEDVFAILKADPDRGLALLIEKYAGYVRAIVLGKLGGFSRQDIEECVSDVFYSIYQSRHTLDSGKGSGIGH